MKLRLWKPAIFLALGAAAGSVLSLAAAPQAPTTAPAATAPAATMPATTMAATAPATQAGPIGPFSWDVAKKHVGKIATIVGPVVGTHIFNPGHNVGISLGKDFPDPARFTVYIPGTDQAGMPDDMYLGKTIAVTGEVILYRDVPEIKTSAKAIVIQK